MSWEFEFGIGVFGMKYLAIERYQNVQNLYFLQIGIY